MTDGGTDIGMNGYAVSNARAEVIASAKHTCPPYWENGVLQVLKTFLKETTNPF